MNIRQAGLKHTFLKPDEPAVSFHCSVLKKI